MKNADASTGEQKKIEMLKTLNSKPRLRALLFLFIYRRLTLTELSDKLGKSKNTVIYHMKKMVNYGIIQETDKKIAGSIKPSKEYHINPEFYEQIFTPFEDLENLSKDEIIEYSKHVFQWNTVLFGTMREFLRDVGEIYTQNEPLLKDIKSTLAFHKKHQTPRDLIPLSEQGYHVYRENYQELMEKTLGFLEKEADEQGELTRPRPYLAFNVILPIKTLVEKKKSRK